MSVPFKIPKRKQPPEADIVHMQSPLSRLQDSIISPFKASWRNGSSNGKKPDQVGSLIGHISRAGKESTFGDACKVRLGPGHLGKGNSIQSTDFQRPGQNPATRQGGHSPQLSQWRGPHLPSTLKTSPPCFQLTVNGTSKTGPLKSEQRVGWRPKRASDTLCQDKNQQTGSASPLFKMSRAQFPDAHPSVKCSPLRSEDEFESDMSPDKEVEPSSKTGDRNSKWTKHDLGTNGFPPQKSEMERRTSGTGSFGLSLNDTKRTTGLFGTSPRGNVPPGHHSQSSDNHDCPTTAGNRGASSSSPTNPPAGLSVTGAEREKRLSLSMPPLRANPHLRDRRPPNKLLSLHLRLRKPAPTSTEPIVLSSEDEEEGPSSECPRLKTPPRQCPPHVKQSVPKQAMDEEVTGSLPPIMELSFWKMHAGVTEAQANGNLVVTDDGITLPLKDSSVTTEEEGVSVSLVASQLRGYGLWDGGLAQGGSLFQDCPGRGAPFLLFLWVSDAQANLVQTELSPLHPITLPGQACPFLLLVLSEQLGDLQAALLASMLDVDAFRQGRSHDLKSPLSWADGLALIHSCPQDAHLLTLLGQSPGAELGTRQSSPIRTRGSHRSQGHYSTQHGLLPTRLIQYPPLPSKGRITVTTEDLDCLDIGQFLNDVIIDFYLKYLLLERAPGPLAERCHVFSSFFYKQLTRRDTSMEEAAAIPARDRRHQRVRTWTRHVDIFNKDYLFVPVNHGAHWYLVVICFPGLERALHEEWSSPSGVWDSGEKRKREAQTSAGPSLEAGNPKKKNGAGGSVGDKQKPTLRPHNPPECTQDGCQRKTIVKKPCILVMDSLKLSYHERIDKLLRDYLQVEWKVRRGTPRDFTLDSMKSSYCKVPLQDNSSDCGLYLLQYAESFLQNPVVHFELPLHLEHWFPQQRVWRKRQEIRNLVLELHSRHSNGESST